MKINEIGLIFVEEEEEFCINEHFMLIKNYNTT
jgi:hypothetical protein